MAGRGQAQARTSTRHAFPDARRIRSAAIWIGVLAVIGGIFYALANTSGIAHTANGSFRLSTSPRSTTARNGRPRQGERQSLHLRLRHDAGAMRRHRHDLRSESNITKIRGMVQKALSAGGGS
jgi:hypothetical protein